LSASTKTPSRNARFVPIGPLCSGGKFACFADGSDAKPDQIEGAGQLEHGEELRAGENDRRDAEAARNHVHKATQCRAEGGGDAGLPASRQCSCRHVENAGPGNCGNDHRGQQEQREVSAAHR
jgi:hypothetical protein